MAFHITSVYNKFYEQWRHAEYQFTFRLASSLQVLRTGRPLTIPTPTSSLMHSRFDVTKSVQDPLRRIKDVYASLILNALIPLYVSSYMVAIALEYLTHEQ